MSHLTHERLKAVIHYDPETGAFTWINPSGKRAKAGTPAGCWSRGYLKIGIDGKEYGGNRLAWLYVYGEWPANEVDHINGNPSDNRIANLRDIDHRLNIQNQRRPHRVNTSGLLGVHWTVSKGKWKASMSHMNKSVHIGYFKTPEEASEAYVNAKRRLHEGCTI